MKKAAKVLVLIVFLGTISGCAIGNKGTLHYNRTTTIGQELMDLKEAKEKDAISDEEYDKAKKNILSEKANIGVGIYSNDKGGCSN